MEQFSGRKEWKYMTWKGPTGGGRYPYGKDTVECYSAEEVIKKVREDRNGIGFFLYEGKPLKGLKAVKILAVGKTDKPL